MKYLLYKLSNGKTPHHEFFLPVHFVSNAKKNYTAVHYHLRLMISNFTIQTFEQFW